MKKHFLIVTVILFTFIGCNSKSEKSKSTFTPNPIILEKQEVTTLEIGNQMPDFELPDMNGQLVKSDDFKNADVLVVVFTCNHCPTAQAYEDRLIEFTNDYKDKGVQVVAIMPTSAAGLLLEECGYTDLDDSFETMKIRANDKGYNFPYLYDGDNQQTTIKFGPTTTPHAFVFDKSRLLQYVGRLDAIEKPGTANAEDLRNATDEILAGKKVSNSVNKAFGCSIKWSWKLEWTKKVNKEWLDKSVTIESINDDSLKQLLRNESENLILINIWATWCAPCVHELPDLAALQRMYGARNFEFITISTDKIENQHKALKTLQNKHIPTTNFIYSGMNQYDFIELVDKEWNGSLPFTLLIEPGGKVRYKTEGIVDLLELKKIIVEHPLMGRYF